MESLIAMKNCEYDKIIDEKSSLHEELKLIKEMLGEKELQLENLVLFKNEQLIAIENFSSTKEKLMQENKQFMVNIFIQ